MHSTASSSPKLLERLKAAPIRQTIVCENGIERSFLKLREELFPVLHDLVANPESGVLEFREQKPRVIRIMFHQQHAQGRADLTIARFCQRSPAHGNLPAAPQSVGL